MKIPLIFLITLAILGVGCVELAQNLESDFKPVFRAATGEDETKPFNEQIKLAISYNGESFHQLDKAIAGQAHTPEAIVFNEKIYLYYTGWIVGDKLSESAVAISENNGSDWIYKHLQFGDTLPQHIEPREIEMVQIDEQTLRMYFVADDDATRTGVHYAESTDGINFTYQGKVLTPQVGVLSHPLIYHENETWHLYVIQDSDLDQIHHFESVDGVQFTHKSTSALPYKGTRMQPSDLISLNGKNYLLLSDQEHNSIVSLYTPNGIDWYPTEESLLMDEESTVEDATIIELEDHQLMFYVTNIE